jgi:hypothetical protein
MNVICIGEQAFLTLIWEVIKYVKSEIKPVTADKWLGKKRSDAAAENKIAHHVTEIKGWGKIRFSQPEKKHIVYDRDSIIEYLEAHAKDPF